MTDDIILIDEAAKGIYAQNGWWREAGPNDDGNGRYREAHGCRMRAVEWTDLSEIEQSGFRRDAISAINVHLEHLASQGLVIVPREPTAAIKKALVAFVAYHERLNGASAKELIAGDWPEEKDLLVQGRAALKEGK